MLVLSHHDDHVLFFTYLFLLPHTVVACYIYLIALDIKWPHRPVTEKVTKELGLESAEGLATQKMKLVINLTLPFSFCLPFPYNWGYKKLLTLPAV